MIIYANRMRHGFQYTVVGRWCLRYNSPIYWTPWTHNIIQNEQKRSPQLNRGETIVDFPKRLTTSPHAFHVCVCASVCGYCVVAHAHLSHFVKCLHHLRHCTHHRRRRRRRWRRRRAVTGAGHHQRGARNQTGNNIRVCAHAKDLKSEQRTECVYTLSTQTHTYHIYVRPTPRAHGVYTMLNAYRNAYSMCVCVWSICVRVCVFGERGTGETLHSSAINVLALSLSKCALVSFINTRNTFVCAGIMVCMHTSTVRMLAHHVKTEIKRLQIYTLFKYLYLSMKKNCVVGQQQQHTPTECYQIFDGICALSRDNRLTVLENDFGDKGSK